MSDFANIEAAIRQLHARYCDAVWRKDIAAFGDCFAKDAEWRIGGQIFSGRTEIMDAITEIFPGFQRILMAFATPILEAGKRTATGRTRATEHFSRSDGVTGLAISTYYEHFVDQGDCWRFSWRLFHLHYYGPTDLSGQYFDNPDFGPPPAMPDLDAQSPAHP